jgi:hypothetical protein
MWFAPSGVVSYVRPPTRQHRARVYGFDTDFILPRRAADSALIDAARGSYAPGASPSAAARRSPW